MSDSPKVEQEAREIQPIIPANKELQGWKGVYLHYTKADRAIPILLKGLWSVSFSHLSGVNSPMEPSGFSPVQEEEGWEWISVYDSDNRSVPWQHLTPYGEHVTFVIKKLPFKTKETIAERKMNAEKLIKWRVAPRDIVALWVSETMKNQTISDFVNGDISSEGMERAYEQFDRLSRDNKGWREKMIDASKEALKKANVKYKGAPYQIVGKIAKEIMTKSLVLEWLKDRYDVTGDSKMTELLKSLEKDSGVKIYMVMRDKDTGYPKTIPIQEIK